LPTETTIETLLKDIKVMAPSKEQILQQKFGINPKTLNRINNSKTLRDTFQKANA
jgi:LysM repeat protein